MTSSLPDFSAPPAVPTTGAAPANSASRADSDAAACKAPAGNFADVMSAQDAAPANAAKASAASATAPTTATVVAPLTFTLLAAPTAQATEASAASATAPTTATVVAPLTFTLLAAPTAQATEAAAEVSAEPAVEGTDDATAPATGEVSRDAMEQAASFMATILQSILPEVVAPIVAQAGGAKTAPTTAAQPELNAPALASQSVAGTVPAVPASTAKVAAETSATKTDATPTAFDIALAADGAVEIKAELPKEQGSAAKSDATAGASVEIQAELALPGQAVVRLTATGTATGDLSGRANFAGKIAAEKSGSVSRGSGVERKFLTTGDKQVKTASSSAGIAVAKTDSTMNSTPLAETRATSTTDINSGPVARGEFTVAWPSTSRAEEPAAAPLEKNFAERAVATVTNLVDTQFTASMQKSGSVQLRLKFGGEDLSVRVELRGGEVHTDFRTDSPELQAALNREWQAVAASSPDQLRQFVQPVFSPSSSQGDSSSSSFAGRQQQQQQQAAQQDLSQQRSPRSATEENVAFTRRSLLGESFAPQAAAPRLPAFLPTSQRLSVLA